jgi:hypothetical protein
VIQIYATDVIAYREEHQCSLQEATKVVRRAEMKRAITEAITVGQLRVVLLDLLDMVP